MNASRWLMAISKKVVGITLATICIVTISSKSSNKVQAFSTPSGTFISSRSSSSSSSSIGNSNNVGQSIRRRHASISGHVYNNNYDQRNSAIFSSSRGEQSDGIRDNNSSKSVDPLILKAAMALKSFSWFSWWTQVILTTVSSVTLIFAKTVLSSTASQQQQTLNLSSGIGGSGFLLAGVGIGLSFLSILWTWGEARLSRRLRRASSTVATSRIAAASITRRAVTIGVTINLCGMAFTLLGAEQIIGVLTAKALSFQNFNAVAGSVQTLQPLDILVVQANANTLLSHFCSLALMLYWGQRWIVKLDPPSTMESARSVPPPESDTKRKNNNKTRGDKNRRRR